MSTLYVHVHLPGRTVAGTLSTERAESSYGRPVLVMQGGGSYPSGPVAFGVGDVTDFGVGACLVLSPANAPEDDEDALSLLAAWNEQASAYRERMGAHLPTMAETWLEATEGPEPTLDDFDDAVRAGVIRTCSARAGEAYGRAWTFSDGSGLCHASDAWHAFGPDRMTRLGRVALAGERAARHVVVRRLPFHNNEVVYRVRGEDVDASTETDVRLVGGRVHVAWWEAWLPPCPDCGGDLVWAEAGYVPGARACAGLPLGGRPTNPIIDARVPLPGDPARDFGPHESHPVGTTVRALIAERNVCPEERIAEIDAEIVRLLYPWSRLSYDQDAGCGSLFLVATEEVVDVG